MTICPMCGNFTDNRNCEVCGIKLNNDDSDKDQQDFRRKSKDAAERRDIYIKLPPKNPGFTLPGR